MQRLGKWGYGLEGDDFISGRRPANMLYYRDTGNFSSAYPGKKACEKSIIKWQYLLPSTYDGEKKVVVVSHIISGWKIQIDTANTGIYFILSYFPFQIFSLLGPLG